MKKPTYEQFVETVERVALKKWNLTEEVLKEMYRLYVKYILNQQTFNLYHVKIMYEMSSDETYRIIHYVEDVKVYQRNSDGISKFKGKFNNVNVTGYIMPDGHKHIIWDGIESNGCDMDNNQLIVECESMDLAGGIKSNEVRIELLSR